ncbi:MAG TPA: ROK family protein, partial [Chitinophagaceae bacterium]|nr:ROK family protein [Chitinophagaceae bacterium]
PGTGKKGSLESYASATGVRYTAIEFLKNTDVPSTLRSIPEDDLDSKKVYEAAIQGDELARNVYEFTGRILGLALANAVMFSSPQAIVLFGGLTKAGDLILKPTREHMEANLIQVFQNKVKILISHLKESDAAILGASALVWEMK